MANQQTGPTVSTMPHTWEKALEMWDAGEPVPAFHVESEGSTQEKLWGTAFEFLRAGTPILSFSSRDFTAREVDVITSIVQVAKLVPWPQMIARHVHANSPALMVRKPQKE